MSGREPAQRRVQIWVDRFGMALSGSVDWIDGHGSTVESLVTAAGPFDSPSDLCQILVDQKPRTHLDKPGLVPQDSLPGMID